MKLTFAALALRSPMSKMLASRDILDIVSWTPSTEARRRLADARHHRTSADSQNHR
jgi:hypothetical protein